MVFKSEKVLSWVTNPRQFIFGEEDYLGDKLGGIQTAECIPNAKLVLIAGMGHLPFNKKILDRVETEIIQFVILNRIR